MREGLIAENTWTFADVGAGAREGKLDVNPGWHSDSDTATKSRSQMNRLRRALQMRVLGTTQ